MLKLYADFVLQYTLNLIFLKHSSLNADIQKLFFEKYAITVHIIYKLKILKLFIVFEYTYPKLMTVKILIFRKKTCYIKCVDKETKDF